MAKYQSNITGKLDMHNYVIGGGTIFGEAVYDLVNWQIGTSLFSKNMVYKDYALEKNPIKTRYDIDTTSLVSKNSEYSINTIGNIGGGPRIGERAIIHENEGRQIVFLDDQGGLVGFTNAQKKNTDGDRLYKDALFDNGIIISGNYNIGDKGYLYSTGKEHRGYLDKSIDSAERQRYTAQETDSITSRESYVGGTASSVGDSVNYTHYNEKNAAKKDNTINILKETDTFSFDQIRTSRHSIVYKTNELFKRGKIGSLISRFKTDGDFGANAWPSSKSTNRRNYGMSRGRNLMTKKAYEEGKSNSYNGYEDPYCRVWTAHHQYSKMGNLIRPFSTEDGFSDNSELNNRLQKMRTFAGKENLATYGTLQTNGFPKITPYRTDNFRDSDSCLKNGIGKAEIQKYMFSIENLAWSKKDFEDFDSKHKYYDENEGKDYSGVHSNAHIGPNGGRIMWFPPYNLKFAENVNVEWNANDFIGRGEKIYTYKNTERSGTLSFTVLVDHPSIVDLFTMNNEVNEENEQKLLRFFAGCGIDLDTPSDCYEEYTEEELEKNKYKDRLVNDDGQIVVRIPVFYPNNYTLKQHRDSDDEIIDAFNDVNIYYESQNIMPGGSIGKLNTKKHKKHTFIPNEYKTSGETIGYPMDTSHSAETFSSEESYYDNVSYGLNTENFSSYLNGNDDIIDQIISGSNLSNSDSKLLKLAYKTASTIVKGSNTKTRYFSLEEILQISSFQGLLDRLGIFDYDYDKYFVQDIKAYGGADSNGYGNKNVTLCTERAKSIQRLLRALNIINAGVGFSGDATVVPNNNAGTKDEVKNFTMGKSNYPKAKAGRCAYIEIIIGKEEESASDDSNVVSVNNKSAEMETSATTKIAEIRRRKIKRDCLSGETYMDEYDFFRKLEFSDNLSYTNLVQKLKYFSPAFHSITPEGFNARLTFLHQCTRQGPTTEVSGERTTKLSEYIGAGNLAFGKAPYCILRIGDFFNTKILIDSLNITYDVDGIKWDLNQEGIGIQPMLANIDMGIKFLGGSDLSGPISRLQNAVSSNYYANTSVYAPQALINDINGVKSGNGNFENK